MPWYAFTPVPPSCDPCDPNNYTLVGSTPPPCPAPNIFLCAIQAMDNMGKPLIVPCAEIAYAISNSIDTANVQLSNVRRC
ncbi:hypothetical protein [Sphingobacterium anhuiense]|uniref:Uncharacterized protein n=1 Tax=Sphingobacterium anhuiense TaxID=493780 RepID=A0ABW5YX00_9SPHI